MSPQIKIDYDAHQKDRAVILFHHKCKKMTNPNIFTKQVASEVISRIQLLKLDTTPQWGKMTVSHRY
jgi:hypothetical protein